MKFSFCNLMLAFFGSLLAMPLLSGCSPDDASVDQRLISARRGEAAIERYGCASCHTIPGIREANALVGPPLDHMAHRVYIAGVLPNSQQNLMRWIKDPPGIDDKTAMPNLHLSDSDVRDIVSYLLTLN